MSLNCMNPFIHLPTSILGRQIIYSVFFYRWFYDYKGLCTGMIVPTIV